MAPGRSGRSYRSPLAEDRLHTSGREQRRRSRRKKGPRGTGTKTRRGTGAAKGAAQAGAPPAPSEPKAPGPDKQRQSRAPAGAGQPKRPKGTQGRRRGDECDEPQPGAAGANDPLRPPGAAAPRGQRPRSAQKGRRPRGPTARRRYSASAWAIRAMWARMPCALPSAPEARGRYYRTLMGKGGLRLCPGKLPGLLWVCTRGFHCRMQCLAAVSGGASGLGRRAPAQHQPRGFAPAQQPLGAIGRLNGAPVGTSLIFRTPGGRSPLLLDTRTLLRHDP